MGLMWLLSSRSATLACAAWPPHDGEENERDERERRPLARSQLEQMSEVRHEHGDVKNRQAEAVFA
jgi:hypothetical protein